LPQRLAPLARYSPDCSPVHRLPATENRGYGRAMDSSTGQVVGRVTELSLLDQMVAAVAAGRGGVAWLEGEPGIGKSALVGVLTERAAALGCTVLRGGGDELLEAFPLRVMAGCLGVSDQSGDAATAEIARLLQGLGHGAGALDPVLAAGERMLAVVDRMCAAGPVVLVAEDLQWADEASLLVWNRLARSVDQIPLLLVGSCRSVPSGRMMARLRETVRARAGVVVDLGPLDVRDAEQLAGRIAGAAPGPRLSAEVARAGGNPLYVREMVEALIRSRSVAVAEDAAELRGDTSAVLGSLAGVIGSKLGSLSEEARGALRMASLLGHEFDVVALALVTGMSVPELVWVIDEATQAGVVTDAGQRLGFRHELLRQVLVGETPAAARSELHSHIARTLAEAGSAVDAVASHLLAASEVLDGWALGWLGGVPESMLLAVPQASAELLTRAVGLVEPDDDRWEVLAARLALALFWLGRDERAHAVAVEVAQRATDVALGSRMRIIAIRSAGRLARAEDAVAVSTVDHEGLPAMWRARLKAWSAVALVDAGQVEASRRTAHAALAEAERCDDELAIASARHALSLSSDPISTMRQIDEALAVLGDDPESIDLRMILLSNRLARLVDFGRVEAVETALPQILVLAERVGTFRAAGLLGSAAEVCFTYGRWDEALLHLGGISPEFLDSGPLKYLRGLAAVIALHRDEPAIADAHLRDADTVARSARPEAEAIALYLIDALALQAEAAGDLDRSLALRSTWLDVPGYHQIERSEEAPQLVRLALAVGDTAPARAAAAICRAVADDEATPMRVVTARFCEALLDDDVGALLALAEEYRGYGRPLPAGLASEEAAVRLALAGDTAGARAALTAAVRAYVQLDATWDIGRADRRLRQHGVRRGPRSLHRRATTGWAALTAAELRIVDLVAKGMANADIAAELFISRLTVQAHVSKILAKLQLRSRLEIIREAAKHAAHSS